MKGAAMRQGKFLVFEGVEGCGKTTQAKLLADRLHDASYDVLLTKEPGGDSGICKKIREILLDPAYKDEMVLRTELLLFEADRAQHADGVIRPALEAGKIVICDRYEAATFAYQCGARQICTPNFYLSVNRFATERLNPDFTFWVDLDPAVGLERNVAAHKRDRFEMERVEFHRAVRQGYADYFEKIAPPGKWKKFDGTLSITELHKEIADTIVAMNP